MGGSNLSLRLPLSDELVVDVGADKVAVILKPNVRIVNVPDDTLFIFAYQYPSISEYQGSHIRRTDQTAIMLFVTLRLNACHWGGGKQLSLLFS